MSSASKMKKFSWPKISSVPANTCSKLTVETLKQGVKYVKS